MARKAPLRGNLGFAFGLAFDVFKNLYVSDALSALYKIAPGGAVSTVFRASDYGTLQTHQFFGVAVDKANNVYLADAVQNVVYRFTTRGQQSIFVSGLAANGLAFDSMGNLWSRLRTKMATFPTAQVFPLVVRSLNLARWKTDDYRVRVRRARPPRYRYRCLWQHLCDRSRVRQPRQSLLFQL